MQQNIKASPGDGNHTVGVRGDQQGVRARVRASGEALEGDDRQT